MNIKRRIVGTAGHIDHGKTSLVRALTGIDTDRLPEEKKRGITIDLGFAFLKSDPYQIGFIDVPGHERFVKNMLAGVGGIDSVLLVVAADESIKPQTREHFEICKLLGISEGVVAITKRDLVDREIADLVALEISELVAGSFLEGKPLIPVSSVTGEGLGELTAAIVASVASARDRDEQRAVFRLPIDRVFTVKGFGSVVTGTTVSGSVARDAELEVLPERLRTKARTLEVHGESRDAAHAGERSSINLADLALSDLRRGQQVTLPDALLTTQILTVELQLLAEAPPLKDQSRVRVHHYASELLANVRLLDATEGTLRPGETTIAQLRLESPVAAAVGDRFVVRRYSPMITIGGGRVLDPAMPRLARGTRPEILDVLRSGNVIERLELIAKTRGAEGLTLEHAAQRFGVQKSFIREQIDSADGAALVRTGDHRWLHADTIAGVRKRAMEYLARYFSGGRMSTGVPKREFVHNIAPEADERTIEFLLADLQREKIITVANDVIDVPGRSKSLGGAEGELARMIEQRFREAGLQVPAVSELINTIAQKPKVIEGVIGYLVKLGTLARLSEGVYVHSDVLSAAAAKMREKRGETVDIAWFKDFFNVSRKVAIPLLEYFDRSGVTKRVGDRRQVL